uniref:bacillithiol system redox-active protein YtxJ n=1 Tax=Flavobacterium sp. TaxID=239 RepID=UPI00404900AF
MNFFSSLFSDANSNESNSNFPWLALDNLGTLEEIIVNSHQKPVVIFKHSTRCSISRFALKTFESDYKPAHDLDFYFLDLIEYRTVSNAIATKFEVQHQSPQILLIQNGVCTYHDSHQDIDFEKLMSKAF